LKEPIAIAMNELGIAVGVVNPHPPVGRSWDLRPTFFRQLRQAPVTASQSPPVMTDARGKFHTLEQRVRRANSCRGGLITDRMSAATRISETMIASRTSR
jgi:hypothetical protein